MGQGRCFLRAVGRAGVSEFVRAGRRACLVLAVVDDQGVVSGYVRLWLFPTVAFLEEPGLVWIGDVGLRVEGHGWMEEG